MRGRKSIVALGLLGALLLAQMPWLAIVFVHLHDSHAVTTAQWNDQVVVVFSHAATESDAEQSHTDHVTSFSEDDNYVRRTTSNSHRLTGATLVSVLHTLPMIGTGCADAVQPPLWTEIIPPLFALRTVVLLV